MGKETGISWTNHTHNFWWGCTKVSPGCAHCYAETMASRYGHDIWGPGKPRRTFADKHNKEPLHWDFNAWKSGIRETVFCGSMMDWCDDEAPQAERDKLWPLVKKTKNLIWLMLTKRPQNIKKYLPPDWSKDNYPNVAMGCTIENNDYADRAKDLTAIDAYIHFISAEPLLGPLDKLDLTGIDWIIVGGESGTGWRKMEEKWATDLRDRCQAQGVSFFYKQDNGQYSGMNPYLEGKEYKQFPERFSLPIWKEE